ncbi:MAG TPA: extracellular solute-binding protein, partial [Fimbriimonadaceae bacterium]|nr:extracellular solute-binding protein [Fimbriimonadaceae bacterium]
TAPDVVHMDPGGFQKFAERGAMLPLNDFIRQTPGFDLSQYYKVLVDASTLDGKLYILPRDIAPIVPIFYNKRIFDEAGIPYPDGKWTWDFHERPELREHDFLWVVHKLTKFGSDGKPVRWGYAPAWKTAFVDMCYKELGARLCDNDAHPTKILYNDPRVIKAYQFAADLSLKQHWIPSDIEMDTVMQTSTLKLFEQGRVAMLQSGIWESPHLRRELIKGQPGYFEWDVAMAPAYKDGTRAYATGGSGYSIMSQTQHPQEAWLLTAWMAGKEGMLASAEAGMAQPAIRWLARSEPWIPGPHTPPDQVDPKNRIIMDVGADYVSYGSTWQYWSEVNGFVDQKLQNIFYGTETAEEALTKGNAEAQRRLDILRAEGRSPPFNWTLAWGFAGLLVLGVATWIYLPDLRKRRTAKERRESRIAHVFILPCLLGILFFTLGPMLLSLLMSTARWDIIQPAEWRGLGNFTDAFTLDQVFWISLKVTAIYTAAAVPLGLITSMGLALLLNTKVRGMPLWRACYYIPSIVSGVAAAIVWRSVFRADGGILNTIIYGTGGHGNFLGIASLLHPLATINGEVDWLGDQRTALASMILKSVWGAGGGMLILLAALQGVPQHFYEAATLDGATKLRQFLHVTIPLISPTLFFALVTGIIGALQVFTDAFVMTSGGPNHATHVYMLNLYQQAFLDLKMGYASALAWILFAITMVFTLAQLRLSSRWVYYEGGDR